MSVKEELVRVREAIVDVPSVGSMIRSEYLDDQGIILHVHYRFPTETLASADTSEVQHPLVRFISPMPISVGIGVATAVAFVVIANS